MNTRITNRLLLRSKLRAAIHARCPELCGALENLELSSYERDLDEALLADLDAGLALAANAFYLAAVEPETTVSMWNEYRDANIDWDYEFDRQDVKAWDEGEV